MDRNLKLAVISVLMEKGLYTFDDAPFAKIGDLTKRMTKVLDYFDKLELSEEQLAAVDEINPDGGDLVYQSVFGGGEGNNIFRDNLKKLKIRSLEGIGACKNLKTLKLDDEFSRKNLKIAPLGELAELEVVDIDVAFTELEALLSCRKLKKASMGGGLTDEEQAVVDELLKRGVEVWVDSRRQPNPS
ncbi:hypothetical protein AKJ09_05687 [Labilithrix luteola]|uniref:DUF6892 domain-containing protein n=2 Tax=Labilithrix luteola TaxID=1391654 RepID=A0A0K1PZS1_9BACT|nr:hypothetical protein AKJ09_05687 [Labilithrix luteola]